VFSSVPTPRPAAPLCTWSRLAMLICSDWCAICQIAGVHRTETKQKKEEYSKQHKGVNGPSNCAANRHTSEVGNGVMLTWPQLNRKQSTRRERDPAARISDCRGIAPKQVRSQFASIIECVRLVSRSACAAGRCSRRERLRQHSQRNPLALVPTEGQDCEFY